MLLGKSWLSYLVHPMLDFWRGFSNLALANRVCSGQASGRKSSANLRQARTLCVALSRSLIDKHFIFCATVFQIDFNGFVSLPQHIKAHLQMQP
jgi:hypothetical protein